MSTLQSEYPKDRRIAELEAAMLKYGRHLPTCYGDTCDCGFCDLDEPAELRAALAAAKREALETAADFVAGFADYPMSKDYLADTLRRMAREVKP